MKRKKLIILLILVLSIILPASVKAKDYGMANDNLNVTKEYNNTAFFAGNNVYVKNKVNGIAFIAGNETKALGESEYAFIAGNTVTIKQSVEKDIFIAGNRIYIEDGTIINKNSFIAGNTVYITSSNFHEDINIIAENVEITDTVISGDLYINASNIVIKDNVTITGKIKHNSDANIKTKDNYNIKTYEVEKSTRDIKDKIIDKLISMGGIVVIGIILYLLFPKIYKKLDKLNENSNAKHIFKNFGIGALILIATPIISIIALMTVIGLPISIITLICYAISIYLSTLFVAYLLGKNILEKVFKKGYNFYLSLIIGVIVTYIIKLIPIIGGIFSIFILLIGLGYIYETIFKKE